MKLVGYVRVSKVAGRSGETFISPDVQREQIAALAVARGHKVVEWVEDLDEPGTKWERPGFQRALEMVESGAADGIAAAKLDRFARSVTDGRRALQRLRDAGCSLVLVAESLDTTTPMGKAMFTIMLTFAELEVDRIRESWQVARSRATSRGCWNARAPFGYRLDKRGRLVVSKREARVVLGAFERRAAGESWHAVCAWLDEVAPRPSGAWPRSTVIGMTQRRTYIGEGEDGQRHDAIVPRAVFEAAARREPRPALRYVKNPRLLTSIVVCAGCGRRMIATGVREGRVTYRCRGSGCPTPARVEAQAADDFAERAFLAWFKLAAPFQIEVTTGKPTSTTDLETALALAEDELAAYRDESLVSVIGRDAFAAGLAKRQAAVDAARDALRDAQPVTSEVRQLVEIWETLSVERKRRALPVLISRVSVTRAAEQGEPLVERLTIEWRPGVVEAIAG